MISSAALAAPSWQQLLERQDRVISRAQARRGGLSEDQWQWMLDSGRWQTAMPGVAVAHSGGVTDRQRAWAAHLCAGEDTYLSADAALIALGMKLSAPTQIHVATTRRVRRRRFRDDPRFQMVPHQVPDLDAWARAEGSPPVLRAAPATLHAAGWAPTDRAGEWRVAAAVQQNLVIASDLRDTLRRMPELPRGDLLAEVIDDVEFGAHAASELDFLRFLRRHQLPMPDRLQRPIRRGTVRYLDAWWEKQRVNVEMDGAHHRLVGTWEDDTLRANDVVLVERHDRILLLRLTRGNLRHDEHRVAGQLRDALL